MATPTTDKLRAYYPSKYLAGDGGTLTQHTAGAGGTARTVVAASFTETDDYWNGAVGWFDGGTASAALRAHFFHVKDFDSASHTLTLARDLPATPAAGDTFRLVLGGNYRSSKEIPGLLVGGDLPEEVAVTGTNITGLMVKKASPKLGAGTLSVRYDHTAEVLSIRMGSEAYGAGLDVSVDVTDGVLFAEDGHAFLQVDVVQASLPGSDQTDTWTLAFPMSTLTPDFEGYETKNDIGGKTRYRLEVVKNTDPTDSMVDIVAYTGRPAGGTTAVATGSSLGTGAGSLEVVDATGWPTKGFWIKNSSVNYGAGDCRYVKSRSGNTLSCVAVTWATLSFQNGITEIQRGHVLTGATSGASAVVDQVRVTSGTWGGGNAEGTLVLKKVEGTFMSNEYLQVGASNVARASGTSRLGLRGFEAWSWVEGQTIELMGDIDIGMEMPSGAQFQDPVDEAQAPAGITFQDTPSYTKGIAIGSLASGEMCGLWRREWILDPHTAREGIDADTFYAWS